MRKKPAYTSRQVRWALEAYLALSEGRMPDVSGEADYGIRIQKSRFLQAIFERPIEMKADIDSAMKRLKPTERGVIISVPICGFDYREVAYWWDVETIQVKSIEDYTIRKIKRILNKGKVENEKVIRYTQRC